MTKEIEKSIAAHHDAKLAAELVAAYEEVKRNFYQGGHRLNAVEGGRFCEAAFRVLEERLDGQFTPLGRQLDTVALSRRLANTAFGAFPDSIRLHIPRSLRVVYDIRNNRNAAHLADGIDPNLQDATIVVAVVDWVLAEFVRIYHGASPDEAQRIVEGLVTRKVPAIEEFDGFLKVLKPSLKASDFSTCLLYTSPSPRDS